MQRIIVSSILEHAFNKEQTLCFLVLQHFICGIYDFVILSGYIFVSNKCILQF